MIVLIILLVIVSIIAFIIYLSNDNYADVGDCKFNIPEPEFKPLNLNKSTSQNNKTTKPKTYVKKTTETKNGVTVTEELCMSERAVNAMRIHNEYASKSSNPKWHRSKQEERLSSDFYCRYSSAINAYENQIYNDGKPFDDNLGVLNCVSACNESLKALNNLKLFCYQSEGGRIYFQDHWEHCHNSKNECFAWSDNLKERIKYLDDNKELLLDKELKLPTLSYDLLDYLKAHNEIIQKDIYADFNPLLKYAIQQQLRDFEKTKIIKRTKYKSSYKIEVI